MGSTTHRLQAAQAPLPWGPGPELKTRKALNMSSLMLTHMYIHVHTHTLAFVCTLIHRHVYARVLLGAGGLAADSPSSRG